MNNFKEKYLEEPDLQDDKINNVLDRVRSNVDKAINQGSDYNFKEGYINLVICMEELAELQQQVSKMIRKKADKYNIMEELADVFIELHCISKLAGVEFNELMKAVKIKLDRYDERDGSINNMFK